MLHDDSIFSKIGASSKPGAVQPADVLSYTIPLPPLAEQQALVARLDALAEKSRQRLHSALGYRSPAAFRKELIERSAR